ncbi:monovalent cation/H(+) antiporter subunit G [Pseudonocardia sp. ICBG1293]|uniref:monovalent cation/H(+) antiporter subunit G n=1 Tax=Pseudonocardia sp. ICBG1293 TaxID=2844382 RepID=UPI001CCDFAB3|nr:monovalent cation/H(+) antiporter subunit G [Pseudonocardia sp. ICBG1293]
MSVLVGGPVQNAIGGVVLGAGVLLVAAGAVGMVRLPDVYNRTNAVTKAAGLGIVAILVGVAVLVPEPGVLLTLGVAVALQLFTIPIASFAIGHAAYRSGPPSTPSTLREDAPGSGEDG